MHSRSQFYSLSHSCSPLFLSFSLSLFLSYTLLFYLYLFPLTFSHSFPTPTPFLSLSSSLSLSLTLRLSLPFSGSLALSPFLSLSQTFSLLPQIHFPVHSFLESRDNISKLIIPARIFRSTTTSNRVCSFSRYHRWRHRRIRCQKNIPCQKGSCHRWSTWLEVRKRSLRCSIIETGSKTGLVTVKSRLVVTKWNLSKVWLKLKKGSSGTKFVSKIELK